MSKQPAVPFPAQGQGVQIVNDFMNHPDFRLVASFSLGWVFFSSLRHIWTSAFVWELARYLKATFSRLRGKVESVSPTDLLHEKSTGAHQPSSVHTADSYRRKQRDTLLLLLCMAFLLASLSSFLSLLIFNPNGSGAACAFVVAVSAIASQAVRVFGLSILGLNLRHQISGVWELWTFWSCLALVTVLNGVTVGLGPGQLVTPLLLPSASLCFRNRFLPTSLVGSILNIVLELYILIRSLSLMKPPRLQCATMQNTLVVQAGSLVFFDLLVIVPQAILTNLIAEFILFSTGALTVLDAFHRPFGQSTFHPTRPNGPDLTSHPPARNTAPLEPPILRGDTSGRLIHIEDHAFSDIALAVHDIEAAAATTNLVAPSRPVKVSVQTTTTSDVTQPDAGDLPRRERILSYSSPIWTNLGARQQNNTGAPSYPQILIGSPSSSNPSPEQDYMVHPSPSSTILGSDIIRGTPSHYGKDRMRIRLSGRSLALWPTSPVPSPISQRATRQSWASMTSARPPVNENIPRSSLISLEETTQPQQLGSSSPRSSRSRRGSKSSRSSRSSKGSIRSAKVVVVPSRAGNIHRATIVRVPMASRLSRGFSVKSQHTRPVGVVRGPRPSPSASRKTF